MNPTQASPGHGPEVPRLTSETTSAQLIKVAIEVLDDHLWPAQYGWSEEMRRAIEVLHGAKNSLIASLTATASRETAGEFAGHTAGPWMTKATASLGPQYAVYAEGDRNDIAIVYDHGPAQANAELIAAAPALLAERDSLRAQLEEMQRASERHDRLAWEQREQFLAQLDAATDALRQRTEQRDRLARACEDAVLYLEQPSGRLAAIQAMRSALAAQGGAK